MSLGLEALILDDLPLAKNLACQRETYWLLVLGFDELDEALVASHTEGPEMPSGLSLRPLAENRRVIESELVLFLHWDACFLDSFVCS